MATVNQTSNLEIDQAPTENGKQTITEGTGLTSSGKQRSYGGTSNMDSTQDDQSESRGILPSDQGYE